MKRLHAILLGFALGAALMGGLWATDHNRMSDDLEYWHNTAIELDQKLVTESGEPYDSLSMPEEVRLDWTK